MEFKFFNGFTNCLNLRVIDAEAELTALLSEEISQQVDNEIMENFFTTTFPVIRRGLGNFIANDLVSVQQLNAPVGLLHYMDFKYKKKFKFGRK
jgi:hypothetical protein